MQAYAARKAAEKAARLATREEIRQRKLAQRRAREVQAQEQKQAALRRAAELVESNRVPLEITQGGAAAQVRVNMAAAQAAVPAAAPALLAPAPPTKKAQRSSIVISTASDLDQIVTHANNLWAKYNAIAQEHNRKVNWAVVAKELGLHVKVREKYARMHLRARSRGFDFVNWGHYRIKDYPQFFLDPLGAVGPETTREEGRGGIEDEGAEQLAPAPALEVRPAAQDNHRASPQGTFQQCPATKIVAAEFRDAMVLAEEAGGFATAYAKDPSVIPMTMAATFEVKQQPPPQATNGEGMQVATAYAKDPPTIVPALAAATEVEQLRLPQATNGEEVSVATAYAKDPSMSVTTTAAAMEVEQHLSSQSTNGEGVHVATTYAKDPSMVATKMAAAMEVEQHPPCQATNGEGVHVVAAYAKDPSLIVTTMAAAAEAEQYRPPQATNGEGVHVVPPFPQVDGMPVDDVMKTMNV